MSAPHGDSLPPSDIARVHDLQQRTATALVLPAKGGRIAARHPDLAAAVNRRARRLLKHLSELLAAMQEANADHEALRLRAGRPE